MHKQHDNIVAIGISARQRAANKLSTVHTSATFAALLDALLNITPRRTQPGAHEVIITPEGDVIVVSDDSQVLHVVALADLRKNIDGIAKVSNQMPTNSQRCTKRWKKRRLRSQAARDVTTCRSMQRRDGGEG